MTASVSSDTICVLVVGKTGVGKTLFLQRLFRSTARYAKKAPMACGHTVGFNVEVVAVDCGGRFEPVNPVVNENPYVAFVEIGGNRHFVSDGQFPLSLMTFQGVIFLYDRYNVDSAMDLVYWYEHLRGYGIVGAEGGAKVMLIETTHIPAAGDASSMARMVPDELVGAYLQENAKKPTTLLRNIFLSARSMGMWFVRTTRFSVADFQVQQQSFASRFAVALYYVLATIGNLVLYVMAITLFGPGQRSVSFYYPSVTKALKTIEDDISGTLTLKECPLYDQQLFEAAALDSVLRKGVVVVRAFLPGCVASRVFRGLVAYSRSRRNEHSHTWAMSGLVSEDFRRAHLPNTFPPQLMVSALSYYGGHVPMALMAVNPTTRCVAENGGCTIGRLKIVCVKGRCRKGECGSDCNNEVAKTHEHLRLTADTGQDLQSIVLGLWWFKRYPSASLHMDHMRKENTPLLLRVKKVLNIKKLQIDKSVVTNEMMHVVSMIRDLETLVVQHCFSESEASLCSVTSILNSRGGGKRNSKMFYLSGVTNLGVLRFLRRLTLISTPLSNQIMSYFCECANLECVVVDSCCGLVSLECFATLQRLTQLSLVSSAISDEGLQPIGKCVSLQYVMLDNCMKLRNVNCLALLHNLRVLIISRNRIPQEGTHCLGKLRDLEVLRFTVFNRPTAVGFITSLKNLVELDLRENWVTDEDCASLVHCKKLQVLRLTSCRHVSDVRWIGSLSMLHTLDLSHTHARNCWFEALSQCRRMTELSLAFSKDVVDISFIGELRMLKHLDLSGTDVGGGNLRVIGRCTMLVFLSLRECRLVTDLRFLETLQELESLNVEGTAVVDSSVCSIALCRKLKFLSLRYCHQLKDVRCLQELKMLETLDLAGTYVTEEGVSTLRQCISLRHVDFTGCSFISHLAFLGSLAGLQHVVADQMNLVNIAGLSGAPSVERVSLTESRRLRVVSRVKLPHLHELSLKRSTILNTGIRTLLVGCCSLWRLDIQHCHSITDLTVLSLLPSLKELLLRNIRAPGDFVTHIAHCERLQKVHITECADVTDVNCMSSLHHLEEVDLSKTNVTTEGIKGLARCFLLKRLNLNECRHVTNVNCLGKLLSLRELRLERTNVTDKGIVGLCNCAQLEKLTLAKCSQITNVERLHNALPHLEDLDVYGTSVDRARRCLGGNQRNHHACTMF